MDPITVTCESACTVTHEVDFPLLSLSVEDGGAIASAVLAVWVVGWAFRVLIRMLKTTDGDSSTSEE